MNITIIIPPRLHPSAPIHQMSFAASLLPPYGAGCLASFLKTHDYSVRLKDLSIRTDEFRSHIKALNNLRMFKQIEEYLFQNKPSKQLGHFAEKMFQLLSIENVDVAGFSVFSKFDLPCALLLAKRIRKKTDAAIVFGGPLITKYTEYRKRDKIDAFIRYFSITDYFIYGEGNIPFVKLLEYLQGHLPIEDVPNLVYRQENELIINPRKLYDIEDMPVPDFDDLPLDLYRQKRIQYYKNSVYSKWDTLQLPYQISRGCPQKCSFCNYYLVDPQLELKSHQKVINELTLLKEKYQTNHFFFCESRLNNSYQYLEKLCDLLIKNNLNIVWRSLSGINNMDKSLLMKMKKAGCYCLAWGIESGSGRILKMMNKGFSRSQAGEILRVAHQVGINNSLCFITGFIREAEEDIDQTIRFIKDNADYITAVSTFDFLLSHYSQIYMHPIKFDIENIHKSYNSLIGFGRLGWDEINGLKWKDKLKQKMKVYRRMQRVTNKIFLKKYSSIF